MSIKDCMVWAAIACVPAFAFANNADLTGHVDPYPDPEPPFHWLVDSQGARAAIVVGQDSSPLEDYAAQEISRYVEEITKASLPILTVPSQDYYPIYIGKAARNRLNYSEWQDLGKEGFLIKNGNGVYGVYIAGNEDLGTLYGAYHFIERHLGVRWFMPDDIGEVIPYSYHNLKVGTFDYTELPSFKVRWIDSGEWALRNKMNVAVNVEGEDVGVNWWPNRGFHTHFLLIPPSVYYDDHPEWFAMHNGVRPKPDDNDHGTQLCHSNPELIEEMAKNIIQIFDDDPSIEILHFSCQDGGGFCECDDCKALDGNRPPDDWHSQYSDRLFWWKNQVANLVAEEHPDKLLLGGAYSRYLRVPQDPNYEHAPNLGIQACHIRACNNHRSAPPTCFRNTDMWAQELLNWSELTDHLFIYEYYRKGAWGNLPYSQIHVIREDIPFYHKIGVKGFYTQRASSYWPAYGLNHYIASKLLWNVELDVDLLLTDFYEKFYGNASEYMRNYYERLERAFREAHACLSPFHYEPAWLAVDHFFTPEVVADLDAAVTAAESVAQDPVVSERIAFVRARVDLVKKYMNYLSVIRTPFEGVDFDDDDALAAASEEVNEL